MIKIKNKFSGKVILKLNADTLSKADLRRANLREADLWRANLRGADLREADLKGADLREADLREANLREADLWGADLWGANLWGANLRGADLRGADLDFSVLPLWCGSFDMKVDTRLVWQLIAHIGRLDTSKVSNKAKTTLKQIEPYFNEFCRYRNDIDKI